MIPLCATLKSFLSRGWQVRPKSQKMPAFRWRRAFLSFGQTGVLRGADSTSSLVTRLSTTLEERVRDPWLCVTGLLRFCLCRSRRYVTAGWFISNNLLVGGLVRSFSRKIAPDYPNLTAASALHFFDLISDKSSISNKFCRPLSVTNLGLARSGHLAVPLPVF